MKELGVYKYYKYCFIFVTVAIMVAYVVMWLFLPVTIDNTSVPTLVNGITTSMSIIIGFGGVVMAFVFRGEIEKGNFKAKKLYFAVLCFFILPLIYLWVAYIWLSTKQFEFAVKYSFGGYLVALWALLLAFLVIARKWDLEKEEKSEKTSEKTEQENTEETEQEKLKRKFQRSAI